MVAPRRTVQLYYNYDKSFVDQVHSVLFHTVNERGVDSSKPVFCVFATPERAFAQVTKQIKAKTGRDVDQKNIPLPIVSITRLAGTVDLNRFVNAWYKRIALNSAGTKFVGAQKPLPYTFPYQVDLWAREIETLDDLQVQMHLWLRANEFWMTINHPFPIGDQLVRAEFLNTTDTSMLESETEQRAVRRTMTFNVEGWLCYAPEEYGIVETIITDFYDTDTDGFLEGQQITETTVIPTEVGHSVT